MGFNNEHLIHILQKSTGEGRSEIWVNTGEDSDNRSDIDLYVVILKTEYGKVYTNQTGGYACNHPSIKGIIVAAFELDNNEGFYVEGWVVDAEKAQANLKRNNIPFEIDTKESNEEAWIHGLFCGAPAILTYTNSD